MLSTIRYDFVALVPKRDLELGIYKWWELSFSKTDQVRTCMQILRNASYLSRVKATLPFCEPRKDNRRSQHLLTSNVQDCWANVSLLFTSLKVLANLVIFLATCPPCVNFNCSGEFAVREMRIFRKYTQGFR